MGGRLRILLQGADIASITSGDGGIDDLTVSGTGRYVRILCLTRATVNGNSLWEFEVYPAPQNIALNKPAVASSSESNSYLPAKAVDGNGSTRWSSSFADNQWIYVDLGQTSSISRVKLVWEFAYALAYKVQVSSDAATWTDVYSETASNGETDDLTGLSASGRYVRILCVTRKTQFGISLWDFEVYP